MTLITCNMVSISNMAKKLNYGFNYQQFSMAPTLVPFLWVHYLLSKLKPRLIWMDISWNILSQNSLFSFNLTHWHSLLTCNQLFVWDYLVNPWVMQCSMWLRNVLGTPLNDSVCNSRYDNFHAIRTCWSVKFGHTHLPEITRAFKWAPYMSCGDNTQVVPTWQIYRNVHFGVSVFDNVSVSYSGPNTMVPVLL